MTNGPCLCCDHPFVDHLDEGGEFAGCWPCEAERHRIREAAWGAGRLRRSLHRLLNFCVWFESHCTKCGREHP